MREKKYRIAQFTFYDRTGIQAFLEREAARGWLLEKVGNFYWRFRRIEPARIHFAVTYFPRASAFDPEPSEEQRRFQDFCAHAGWQLAGASAQLQIFYNEGADPLPIETDAAMEVENIHRAAKKSFLPSYFMLLALGVMQGALFCWRLAGDPIGVLSSNLNLFTGLCWMALILMMLVEIVGYFRWRRRARAAAEDGGFVATRGHRNFQLAMLAVVMAAYALLLLTLGDGRMLLILGISFALLGVVLAATLGLKALLKRRKVPAGASRAITMAAVVVLSVGVTGFGLVIGIRGAEAGWFSREPVETYEYQGWTFRLYDDALPLTVGDMTGAEGDGYSKQLIAQESLLLGEFSGRQDPRMDALELPSLRYEIVEVKLPLLYDWCVGLMLEEFEDYLDPGAAWAVPVDAAPWGAEEAWRLCYGEEPADRWLLCYESRIVELVPDWEPSPEEMAAVGEKLGG